ncbi:MAG TPA: MotA/TolQ/ExbB proton channel family protein [Phycisphaerae bacterium]|nr:MotA/TolQ/ExbB proton channel family protein [Phycisphaerae bacterium]
MNVSIMAATMMPHWIFQAFDWFVISMLALASFAGVGLAISAMLHIRESKIAPATTTEHLRSLIAGRDFRQLMDFTATDQTFVSQSLYAALRRAHLKYPAMREAMETSIGEQTANMFRRIEPLNVIGNIGPLLGLLGTVLGMIMAFYKLVELGGNTVNAQQLEQGIGTALWHTFFGLFVAIPCLVVYGFYRVRADKISNKAALVAEELLENLRPEAMADDAERKKAATRPTTAAASPMPAPAPQGFERSEG